MFQRRRNPESRCILFRRRCLGPRAHPGRDRWGSVLSTSAGCFNPRVSAGRDLSLLFQRSLSQCFNPRAARGATSAFIQEGIGAIVFQSTRPRGTRPKPLSLYRSSY